VACRFDCNLHQRGKRNTKKLIKGVWLYEIDPVENRIPKYLEIAIDCKNWNTLPLAGGWLDQPAAMTNRMKVAYRLYNGFVEYRKFRKTGGESWVTWQKENKNLIDMIASLAKGEYD